MGILLNIENARGTNRLSYCPTGTKLPAADKQPDCTILYRRLIRL